MTEDERFNKILSEHGAEACKYCGRIIDRGDVSWNCACTDFGTPMSYIMIHCQACDNEVACVDSWYPEIDDFDECLDVLEKDWKK